MAAGGDVPEADGGVAEEGGVAGGDGAGGAGVLPAFSGAVFYGLAPDGTTELLIAATEVEYKELAEEDAVRAGAVLAPPTILST